MSIYLISELLDCLNDFQNQGLKYVEISEFTDDEDDISILNLDAIEDNVSTINEQIESVSID